MDINKEYTDYLTFVERYYPKSSMIEANRKNIFKEIILNKLKAIKLLDMYCHIDKISDDPKFLIKDLKMYFIRLLYILPTNDYYFVDVLLRSMSENILRIVYNIIFPDVSLVSIKNLNHRNLWSSGIKTTTVFQKYNEKLSEINRIFRNKSSTVHSTQKMYSNQVNYLIDLMEDNTQISIKQLNSDVHTIYTFLSNIMMELFNLKEEDLTMQQTVTLKTLT